jgi:hypothetical protein
MKNKKYHAVRTNENKMKNKKYHTVRTNENKMKYKKYHTVRTNENGQYILVSDTIMAVFLFSIILYVVPIDRGPSFLLKVRWTICFSYQNVSQYNNQENNTAMTVSPRNIYCPTDLK